MGVFVSRRVTSEKPRLSQKKASPFVLQCSVFWFRIREGRLFYSLQLRGVTSAMRIEQVQQAQIMILFEDLMIDFQANQKNKEFV